MAFSARKNNGNDLYQPLAEINVTPLVDVMLVLLIIFMITAPLLAKGVKVNLPQAKAAVPLNQKDPIIVTVGKDGKIALGADEVSPDNLIDEIRAMMGDDANRVVHIRGDTEAVYGQVVAVMDKLATNGITHIAIMTNSKKGAAATEAAPAPGGESAAPAAQAPAAATSAPASGGGGK